LKTWRNNINNYLFALVYIFMLWKYFKYSIVRPGKLVKNDILLYVFELIEDWKTIY